MDAAKRIINALENVRSNGCETEVRPGLKLLHLKNRAGKGLGFWKSVDFLKKLGFKVITS